MARLFAEQGIEAILLKGPTLQPAWGDIPRPYVDVDLLVAPDEHERARAALEAVGFVARADLAPGHAATLCRDGDAHVDLHWTLISSRVTPTRTWTAFLGRVEGEDHDGLLRLDGAATTCVAVLHASRTRAAVTKPAADVRALVSRPAPFVEALELATALGAERAFVRGLCVVESGKGVATTLGLDPPTRLEIVTGRLAMKGRLVRNAYAAGGFRGAARYVWPASGPQPITSEALRRRLARAVGDLVR